MSTASFFKKLIKKDAGLQVAIFDRVGVVRSWLGQPAKCPCICQASCFETFERYYPGQNVADFVEPVQQGFFKISRQCGTVHYYKSRIKPYTKGLFIAFSRLVAVVDRDLKICWVHPRVCFGIAGSDYRAINIAHGKDYTGLAPAASFLGLGPKDICSSIDAAWMIDQGATALTDSGGAQKLIRFSLNSKSHIRRSVSMFHAKNLYSFLSF